MYVDSIFILSEEFDHQLAHLSHLENEFGENALRNMVSKEIDFAWHFISHYRLTRMDYYYTGDFGHRIPYSEVGSPYHIPAINRHETAASFVIYLIHTHGIDSFVHVLWDTHNFYHTYGRDIHGMVEEWREFLHYFVENHEYYYEWESISQSFWG
ncbi:MAG: hypothetical protein FWE21_02800 [Defluviitaleaceae bacterium]|nr:hypothetical protein [Defluviitaleaceae bacterium]